MRQEGVPAQAQGQGVRLLVQAPMVELRAVIVQVRGVHQLRISLRWIILHRKRLHSCTKVHMLVQQTLAGLQSYEKYMCGTHLYVAVSSILVVHSNLLFASGVAAVGRWRTAWNWKTGRCCRMWCFTAEASVVRTQYLVVDRTKPWHVKESSSADVDNCITEECICLTV